MKGKKLKAATALAGISASYWAMANEVNVQTFLPKANPDYTLTESGRPLGATDEAPRRLFFSGTLNTLNDPLVILNQDRSRRLETTLDSIRTFDLVTGVEWNGKFSLNAALPAHQVHELSGKTTSGIGDLRVFPKIYLGERSDATNIALIPELTLPTGSSGLFVSDTGLGTGLLAAVERDWSFLKTAVNAGFRFNPKAIQADLDYRRRLVLSASAQKPLGSKWAVNLEGSKIFTLPFNSAQNPNELQAGLLWRFDPDWVAAAGAGFGTTNTITSADTRFLVSLRFSPINGGNGRAEYIGANSNATGGASSALAQPEEIKTTSASAVMTPSTIELSQEVTFLHNSAVLVPSAKKVLGEVAKLILGDPNPIEQVRIEGHTNELGSDGYNLKLSQRRANSVKDYLIDQGVQSELLKAEGFGKRRPKPGSEKLPREERLAVNRRVEFQIDRPTGGDTSVKP